MLRTYIHTYIHAGLVYACFRDKKGAKLLESLEVIHTYIHIYIYMCVCVLMYRCIRTYIYTYTIIYTEIYLCVRIFLCVCDERFFSFCVDICKVQAHTRICTYIYTCIHTYIHTFIVQCHSN